MSYHSRYLLEYKGYFSRSHLILMIHDDYLLLQPLAEEGAIATRIEMESIVGVEASDRNLKEFTLSVNTEFVKKTNGGKRPNAEVGGDSMKRSK